MTLSDCDLLADENVHLKVVQFLRMQAYIEWLSEETGRNHRLPTEKEIGSIQKLADASENNLGYWAGYAPTPDERQALEVHPDGTDSDRLLMPVGSRPPGNAKEKHAPLVFDADGNAAEWAVGEDGSGTAEGASAVSSKTIKPLRTRPRPPGFIGLRVVVKQ